MRDALDKSAQPPDYVIQFWTEPLRDKDWEREPKPWRLDEILDRLVQNTADQYKQLRRRMPKTQWAMIGGQAPLHPNYAELFAPEFAIEDWRGELLGRRWSYSVSNVAFHTYLLSGHTPRPWIIAGQNKDEKKAKKTILKQAVELRDALDASELFPDGFHPGWPAYEQLLVRIIEWLRSS